MTMPVLVQRLAERWHISRNEDELVQDYVRLLRRDNVRLRRQKFLLKVGRLTPSGWYVLKRVVQVSLLAGMVGVVVLLFQYESGQIQIRQARRERAARSVVPAVQASLREKRERAARASELRGARIGR